ncbi:MAG: 1-acyl-sn-glycerol-3-phosphate acyltransferase [Gemmatimonadota bacterium]
MWLLPFVSRLSRWAAHGYYRFAVAGPPTPVEGPVLYVANHPNSLVDPAFVAAAAGRPVRFLAKSPLFTDPVVGWLIRAAGAIPVYRRQDDPSLMDRNVSTFEAAHEALAAGAAVGIFPEGLSHSDPSLATLRTGAARIALGAAAGGLGAAFPIVPVGIVLRRKERFRSRALAVVGAAIRWDDLAGRAEEDVEAVRELTARIETALREVTVNLERWEDAPAVECAEAIYAAEFGLERDVAARVKRLRQVTEGLGVLRRQDPERLRGLYASVSRFAAVMEMLGTTPAALDRLVRPRAAAGWVVRRLVYFGILAPLALVGHVLFAVPYWLTGRIESVVDLEPDVRATHKLLGGIAIYAGWIALLAGALGLAAGRPWGLAALAALPALGFLTQGVRDRWGRARADARRWLLLRRRAALRARLLRRRAELAAELDELRERLVIGGDGSYE